MKRGLTGHYLPISTVDEICRAFVPNPLPPKPPLQLDDRLLTLAQDAALALGRLDALSSLLPDPQVFLYSYVRKEAVLSSQIEGTQSSLSDLLLFEAEGNPGVPLDDVREVSNYVAALELGIARMQEGLPISLRLICETHAVLLRDGRGAGKLPGEFRRSQNWIGGTRPGNARHVPPPPDKVLECMGALENFLHGKPSILPVLIRAALAHVQFETIHPFLDGNGRLGRLLIVFLLHTEGVLRQPLLYLSLYFMQHRSRYYELLQAVRLEGDWEEWIEFFLEGVINVASGAVDTAQHLLALFQQHRQQVRGLGRRAASALRLLDHLQHHPISTAPRAVTATGMTFNTAQSTFRALADLGIVAAADERKYGKYYTYTDYLALLNRNA
ncbi:MAG: Fic family protein [Burkholderiales bacterium]|jgi:Fic family protein|nr:Fic family protein [Burkholderiales bacterium]